MPSRRDLLTICRQIGTMTEVGVDILRILRVLRESTDNERLLDFYNAVEAEMRLGGNWSDALALAPDLWSPFAVSLVAAGEQSGDIEGAWHRLADHYKQEVVEERELTLLETPDVTAAEFEKAQIEVFGDSSERQSSSAPLTTLPPRDDHALVEAVRQGAQLVSATLLLGTAVVAALLLRGSQRGS